MPKLSNYVSGDLYHKLQNDIQPPIITIEDFLERDSIVIVKALKCSLELIVSLKKDISWKILQETSCSHITDQWKGSLKSFPAAVPELLSGNTQINSFRPSGFPELDELLPTGYPSGQIISIIGEAQTGKTQLIMTSVVASAMRGYNTLLVDTCNHFTLKRLTYIIEYLITNDQLQNPHMIFTSPDRGKERINEILNKISIVHCFDLFQLLNLFTKLSSVSSSYDLIAVDCLHHLIAPFPSDNIGSSSSSSSSSASSSARPVASIQPFLSQLALLMKSLVVKHQSTLLITNVLNNKEVLPFHLRPSGGREAGVNELVTGGAASQLGVYDMILRLKIDNQESNEKTTVIIAGKASVT
jgi:RecA/RadA recombinase